MIPFVSAHDSCAQTVHPAQQSHSSSCLPIAWCIVLFATVVVNQLLQSSFLCFGLSFILLSSWRFLLVQARVWVQAWLTADFCCWDVTLLRQHSPSSRTQHPTTVARMARSHQHWTLVWWNGQGRIVIDCNSFLFDAVRKMITKHSALSVNALNTSLQRVFYHEVSDAK